MKHLTPVAAETTGDSRLHATFAGRTICLCGAPIARTVPGTFAGRDPDSCPICALALVMQQSDRKHEGS